MEGLETRWRVIIAILYASSGLFPYQMLLAGNSLTWYCRWGFKLTWRADSLFWSERQRARVFHQCDCQSVWDVLRTWSDLDNMSCHNFIAASLNIETELLLCTFQWIWHYGHWFSSAESCAVWIALGQVNKPGCVWHHLVFPQAPWARWHYQISFESKHAFLTRHWEKHWIGLLFSGPSVSNLCASLSIL